MGRLQNLSLHRFPYTLPLVCCFPSQMSEAHIRQMRSEKDPCFLVAPPAVVPLFSWNNPLDFLHLDGCLARPFLFSMVCINGSDKTKSTRNSTLPSAFTVSDAKIGIKLSLRFLLCDFTSSHFFPSRQPLFSRSS